MHALRWGKSEIETARIGYGCMHLGAGWSEEPPTSEARMRAARAIDAALECGVTLFDHADIYCRGKSEQVFGMVLRDRPHLRQAIILQSKCGIRLPDDSRSFTVYDFRKAHIVGSVEASLRRLGTEYLDVLLLHRPDPLMIPDEVAAAFDELRRTGKVRFFGVSNHSAAQLALLTRHLDVPIVANQLELNIVHNALFDQGVQVNQVASPWDATGTFEYCRLHGICIQAWSPLGKGYLCGRSVPSDHPRASQLTTAAGAVRAVATRKGVPCEAICLAWLLRHPAGILPIVGTTDPARVGAACGADGVELSHEEWYELLIAGRGRPMP